MFNDIILGHFQNPRNAGDLDGSNAQVEVSNPVCGDILRLAAHIEGNRIAAVRFKTQGCVAAIAASSLLTELLTGRSREEVRQITAENISESLG